jgi:Bacteriophage probable baseplate hub protein
VTIEGADMPATAYHDLLDVSVVDDLEAPSMFTLRLLTWDDASSSFTWVDDALFAIGNDVEIGLGYTGDVATVIAGEITSLELELAAGEAPRLLVRGYDRRHRLARGTRTQTFTSMKDSDIAAQIARARQLTPVVTDSEAVHAYVAQVAQTDLEFLNERAKSLNYVVVASGTSLYFGPPPENQTPKLALSMSVDVIDFSPRMSTRHQPGSVELRAWDPKTKQPIVAGASSADLDAMGATTGPALADRAFGAAVVSVVNRPVTTQQEADQIAKSALEEAASGFIVGQGTALGRTALRAGTVVDLQGIGARFSGSYDVLTTTHAYSLSSGYTTRFSTSRNAT